VIIHLEILLLPVNQAVVPNLNPHVLLRTIAEVQTTIKVQIITAEEVARTIITPLEEDNNQV
jgi:hypothetical protein